MHDLHEVSQYFYYMCYLQGMSHIILEITVHIEIYEHMLTNIMYLKNFLYAI